MKKLFYLIIGIIVLCLILVFISIHITCDFIQGLDLASNFISVFSGLITLIIAFLLFDRFGITNKVVNFQTDTVIQLVEKLKKFGCAVKGKKITYQIPFSQDLNERKILIKNEHDENKRLIFSGNIGERSFNNEINKLINDPWLPSNIKNKIKFLEYYGTYTIPEGEDLPEDKLVVIFGGTEQREFLILGDLTFIQFLEKIESLKKEISNWLQQHSSLKIDRDLNIKP